METLPAPITMTAEQVQAVIGGFDLRTYDGWRRAAYALLKDKPEWTAIKTDGLGYVVWCEGDALLIEEDVDALADNLLDIDDQGWDYELGCWAVTTPGTSNSWLVYPEFVTLVPAEEQGDICNVDAQPAIGGFDLSTFAGWLSAAASLLADKPNWTAIKTGEIGHLVRCDGDLYTLEQGDDPLPINLLYPDYEAWDDASGCWEGSTPADCAKWLQQPEFVTLVPVEDQGDIFAAETQPAALEAAIDLPSDFSELINAARIHCAEQIEEIEAHPSFYSAANLAEADNHRLMIERQAEALERYAAMRKRQAQAQSN